ncbi:hypothetical protein RV02_GL001248 [Enterococcus gilvus]|nr:hypothetical protein RV02_GL001248 [Enterococcus gilvus]
MNATIFMIQKWIDSLKNCEIVETNDNQIASKFDKEVNKK